MQDRALQYPLESQRRLGFPVVVGWQKRRCLINKGLEVFAQRIQVSAACAQHLKGGRVIGERQQQMLHGQKLVSLVAGLFKGEVQRKLEFFA